MQDVLRQRELEVKEARARFADDLAVLRSPMTLTAFTEDLKQDAMEAKDELIEKARYAVESKVTGVFEDIKAKAAANPAAALMIGAGVGWYLLRRPPITTALVGYGVFSLLRTQASVQPHARTRDYLRQGQERLKQQATEFASQVADKASAMGQEAAATIAEKSDELFDTATDQMTQLAQDTGAKVRVGVSAVQNRISSVMARTGAMAADLSHSAEHATQRTSSQVSRSFDNVVEAKNALPDGDARDRLLLGLAGIAVAAALGIAWQRRLTENV